MISLPIPDISSVVSYGDIQVGGESLGTLVSDLSGGRIGAGHGAHLDPDLAIGSLPRQKEWRPVFGQAGPAQGHLRNQGVDVGDLFLFFGLFRHVEKIRGRYRFQKHSRPRHVIWGWLQVGAVVHLEEWLAPQMGLPPDSAWLTYHPHCQAQNLVNNTLYIAAESLSDNGSAKPQSGAGVFGKFESHRQLTAPDATLVSEWQLPGWFYPTAKRAPLSYHSRASRWSRNGDKTLLQAAARGQEFVLDCDQYPEARQWAYGMIGEAFK